MVEEEAIGLDLEDVLSKDKEGVEKERLREELQAKADTLKKAIDAGAPQGLYQRLERQYSGYSAAVETIRAFWARIHSKA